MISIKEVANVSFKDDTLIEDPVIYPYFIVSYHENGGFAVCKGRESERRGVTYSVLCYPSTFTRCLEVISQSLANEPGKRYESIKEYVDNWKKISDKITETFNKLK